MSLPLISADSIFAIWAAIFVIVIFSLWLEKTKIGATVSAVVIIILTSIVLSNLSIIPKSAGAYDVIGGYLLPLAIPLLLFKADLRRIIPETKGLLIAFLFGTLGTIIGVLIGVWLLPLGDSSHQLAGIFSATYIGGSMNMAAVAQVVEIDPTVLSSSVAADNVIGIMYLGLLIIMPSIKILHRYFPTKIIQQAKSLEIHSTQTTVDNFPQMDLLHICFALTLSLVITAISYGIAQFLGIKNYAILFITAITVLIANIFPRQLKKLQGDYEIGMLFMYLFFVIIGASADIALMIDGALVLVLFTIIIIFFHLITILLGGKLFKLDLAEILIASNACAMGPATAVAMAAKNNWKTLTTPAIMLGVFGYVIANFVGVTLSNYLA